MIIKKITDFLVNTENCGSVQLPYLNSRAQKSDATFLKSHEASVTEVRLHLDPKFKKYMEVYLL